MKIRIKSEITYLNVIIKRNQIMKNKHYLALIDILSTY